MSHLSIVVGCCVSEEGFDMVLFSVGVYIAVCYHSLFCASLWYEARLDSK